MNKAYEKLDTLIILAISASSANPMHSSEVAAEGKRIAKNSGRYYMRVIDGRLQALRKAGKIEFRKKQRDPKGKHGWYVGASAEVTRPAACGRSGEPKAN